MTETWSVLSILKAQFTHLPVFLHSLLRGILFILCIHISGFIKASVPDSSKPYGFVSISEARDSIFHYLSQKKDPNILRFALNESMFLHEFRKTDTTTHETLIQGQFLNYGYTVKKGFDKTLKSLLKKEVSLKKLKLDTLLFFANSGDAHFKKCELYVSQRQFKAYISFNLWKVDDLWYLGNKMELVTLREKE